MRQLDAILLLAVVAQTAHPVEPPSPVQAEPGAQPGAAGPHTTTAQPAYPLWDGQETIEQYARRAKLEPTKTLDLGNHVRLEMVLIPAGKFVMGTPEPTPVDEEPFVTRIWLGQFAVAASVGVLLVFVAVVIIRAIRRKQRPQYSLARFVAIIGVVGAGVLGGMHWWESARRFAEAQAEYQGALARYSKADASEKPAHEVTLTQPFYLGKFEVTQEQYQRVMGYNRSNFTGRDLPVENVSWQEAQEFCKKASEVARSSRSRGDSEGRPTVIRLPTEAEWEHACRAGTRTTYCTGDAERDLARAAWYERNSGNTTHPVGKKTPNAWGLYDMHGNVWEWCWDWFETYEPEAAVDPQGPAQGPVHVLRGGSCRFDPWICRSAYRFSYFADYRYFMGFRVAASVPSKTP